MNLNIKKFVVYLLMVKYRDILNNNNCSEQIKTNNYLQLDSII